jgi:hypothetical protein
MNLPGFPRRGTEVVTEASAALGCRDCGIRVTDVLAPLETETATARESAMPTTQGTTRVHTVEVSVEVRMSLCDHCRDRNAAAARLVDEHPSIARRLGDRWYSTLVFESVLLAVDLIDMDWQHVVEASQKALPVFVQRLRDLGNPLRWSTLLVPVIRIEANPEDPSKTRWAHVSEEARQHVRDEYATLLADVHLGPRTFVPPEGDETRTALRGCLFCGIGTVQGSRRDGEAVWGELRSAAPATLGALGRPEDAHGYLCPVCRGAATLVGPGLGATAMERAFFAYLKVAPKSLPESQEGMFGQTTVRVEGLRAWCVLPVGTRPNSTPWSHVADLEGAATRLRELS